MNRRSFFGSLLGAISAPFVAKAMPKPLVTPPGLLFHKNAFHLPFRPLPIKLERVLESHEFKWSSDELLPYLTMEEFAKRYIRPMYDMDREIAFLSGDERPDIGVSFDPARLPA